LDIKKREFWKRCVSIKFRRTMKRKKRTQ